jgi:hypothetical protein
VPQDMLFCIDSAMPHLDLVLFNAVKWELLFHESFIGGIAFANDQRKLVAWNADIC